MFGFCFSHIYINMNILGLLKVKYDFSTNEAGNNCNTSFSCDFDWEIDSMTRRSSSRSKREF